MMKRFISILAALCLVLTLMPGTVWAETVTNPKPDSEWLIPVQTNPRHGNVPQEAVTTLSKPEQEAPRQRGDYVSEEEAAAQLRAQMVARQEQIPLRIKTTNSDLNDVLIKLFEKAMAHTGVPTEGDYLAWHYKSWGVQGCDVRYEQDDLYIDVTYELTYYTTAAQEAELTRRINSLMAELALNGLSDYDKICGIYNYMIQNIRYDYGNMANSAYTRMFTAYAALLDGTAVCQGYANLFYRLALMLGVDNRIVTGQANGGPHAWNIVELEDMYYYLDSTWDSIYVQGGAPRTFFLKGSSNFTDHVYDPVWSPFVPDYPISRTDYTRGTILPDDEFDDDDEVLPAPDYLKQEWEVLKQTNRERLICGRDPVTLTEKLAQAADIRAEEITRYYDHTRPDGSSYSTVLGKVGAVCGLTGENIAAGQTSPEEVMYDWMHSGGHRANILTEDFSHMGVGMEKVSENFEYYWVQLFCASKDCAYTSLTLNEDAMIVNQGTSLNDVELWATVICDSCGVCWLPVTAELCSGYDPNTTGTQTVTVSAYGLTDTVTITVVGSEPDPDPQPQPEVEYLKCEWELLRRINRERESRGLRPYTANELLFLAADIRAGELTEGDNFYRPSGNPYYTVMHQVGYQFYLCGENTASGAETADAVFALWESDSTDWGNLTYNFYGAFHIGLGYNAEGHRWDALFADSGNCAYTAMHLNTRTLEVERGTALEDMPLWITMNCTGCGDCYLPVLETYCSGYDPNAAGTQTVTVSCYGFTDTVQITVTGADSGDVNGDGRVNAMDLILLRQHLAGWEVTIDQAGGDANGDGRVNAMDLILLRQKLAGWDVTLGTAR